MSRFPSIERLLAGSVFFVLVAAASGVAAQPAASPPDFQNAWLAMGGEFKEIPGATPTPVRQDPRYRYVPNNTADQPTYRIGDVSNPNLKPWVVEAMKKDNDEVLAGKYAYTARSSCAHAGVPGFMGFGAQPIYFVQTPKEVVMIFQGDAQVRRIYLDVPHSATPKPSWYGESVGHYEGDELVIDTIGLNNKTFIDAYRTPHSDKLHVTERWKMASDGKTLEALIRIEDADAFNQPFSVMQRYGRVQQTLVEQVCAENNGYFFGARVPTADKPEF
jgi:hypothetical protein